MFSKITDKFSKNSEIEVEVEVEVEDKDKGREISNKISEGITKLVGRVITEREEYYKNNLPLSIESLDGMVSSFANKNALISGGAGLIPGPWGMAAAIPEILAVVRNQLIMVYDISKAYGHNIDKEALISILFGAVGNSATSLVVIQGQKVMAKRVGAKALQSLIHALGGKITQQLAKSMAAKWLPVAGAIAMATWSRYSTKKIGGKAIGIFLDAGSDEKNELIDIDNEDIIEDKPVLTSSAAIDELKIISMIELMKIDGNIDDKEVEFISGFIEKTDLTSSKKIELIKLIKSNEKSRPDYELLNKDPEEKLNFIIDLVSLAKADGKFDITEKMFVKEIGRMLNFDKDDIEELMA